MQLHCFTCSGRELNESVGGIAYLGGMCSFSEVGVVVDISYSLDFVGAVLAHEVGHLFSMEHDSRRKYQGSHPKLYGSMLCLNEFGG